MGNSAATPCKGKIPAWLAALAAAVGATTLVGFVSVVLHLARAAVRLDRDIDRPLRVLDVRNSSMDGRNFIFLRGQGAAAAGAHSLIFDQPNLRKRQRGRACGHARLGPPLADVNGVVKREIIAVDSGDLVAGVVARMTGWWFISPDELGYRVEEISYESAAGTFSGWIVHPRRSRAGRWAVHTHGRGAKAAETLRGVVPLAAAGITSLVICYRNDPGQPAGLHNRYGLGLAESEEVVAAAQFAVRRGARRVTLVGWSMGGSASLVAAASGELAGVLDGVVLDSPGVDWVKLLRKQAALRGVPGWIADAAMVLLSRGWVRSGQAGGINFARLHAAYFAQNLSVPALVLGSPNDNFVPLEGARELARLRPDLVKLVEMPAAGHVRLWNSDPEKWQQIVQDFVLQLPKPAGCGQ